MERGDLRLAGATPGRPEIENDRLAAKTRQVNVLAVHIFQREVQAREVSAGTGSTSLDAQDGNVAIAAAAASARKTSVASPNAPSNQHYYIPGRRLHASAPLSPWSVSSRDRRPVHKAFMEARGLLIPARCKISSEGLTPSFPYRGAPMRMRRLRISSLFAGFLSFAVCTLSPAPVTAQTPFVPYFGKNLVRHTKFEWLI